MSPTKAFLEACLEVGQGAYQGVVRVFLVVFPVAFREVCLRLIREVDQAASPVAYQGFESAFQSQEVSPEAFQDLVFLSRLLYITVSIA